tara:strand:- start:1102 stop:2079 length:978 start_codon:yes stop_codon:yes gene_type:complete
MISGKFKDCLASNQELKEIENTIIFQLHKLFSVSLSLENGIVTPTTLRKVCASKDTIYNRWGSQEQQDSPDFLLFLLEKLIEEIGQKVVFIPGKINYSNQNIENSFELLISTIDYNKFLEKEFSPLTNLFNGLGHATTQCKVCKNKNSKFETFKVLEVEIPDLKKDIDIYDCLDKWSESEELDDENRYLCSFCGVKSNASRKHLIMKTPKILIIHLKRFKKDMFGRILGKNNTKINFPLYDLSLKKYVSGSSKDIDKNNYNLYGVNCHYGIGQGQINFGHYISIVKNRYDDNWYIFNDAINPQKVLKESDIINPNSYILFYVRSN